ncbi:hypothetical protein [Candidatus Frankia nodulisporulans]|uniref:hypothetical protein n=1 Tax=Candidatus Frankia nodulisporulans TaxID=2060052 RepID=UPI00158187E8|nr:hypothetical protein [Candidatus Frankia nodulisporulans]
MGSHSAGRHARHGTTNQRSTDRRSLDRRPAGPAARPAALTPETAAPRPAPWPTPWPVPARPPVAPPGERDTITGPLSVSTTARRDRELAQYAPSRYTTSSVLVPTATPRPPAAPAWPATDSWPDDADPYPATGGHPIPSTGIPSTDQAAPNQAWDTDQLPDDAWYEQPMSDGTHWADDDANGYGGYSNGADFTASRMPVRPAGMVPAPRPRDTQAVRLPGAHRAPTRRGNGRVRLAAAGTVSLAGLSAIVAGVTLGGEQPGSATVPTNGDASRIQYNGSTDALALGASQSQAARGSIRSTAPRAVPAPHPGQSTDGTSSAVTTTTLGPTTAPIPILTLVPQGTATGPTDLRGLTPGTSSTGTPGSTPTSPTSPTSDATISPSTSPSATGDPDTGLPFTPDTPSASPAASSPWSSPSSSVLQPGPISITPLLPRSTTAAGH